MPQRNDILDTPILSLSEVDHLDVRSLCEGSLITGAPGAGKSSCSGKQIAYGLLRVPRMGGLVLTAKAEETQNWIGYAKACGREKDLIIFNAESGYCFDPLHYEWTRPGRGQGDLESVIDFFSTLVSIGKKEVGHAHDPFWERGNEQLMRNVIKLLDLAGERVSIANIDRVIKSLPTRPNEYEEEAWQKDSYCAQLITSIRERQDTLTPDQWSDLDFSTQYIFRKWPAFDERPRSSLEMTWSGMADKFLFNPFNRLFCSGKCSFTPEMTTHQGKIVICDFPLLEYGHETGRLINVILKLIFQRAWLRRKLSESPHPVFLWQDEMQYFVTRRDNFFQQTCRGSRVAVVCLTQNILNLSEELGEDQPGSKTKSFLGNLGVKIFHQQNDTETCNYAADQIGREYRYLDNFNAGGGDNNHAHASVGASQQLVHLVEPIEFTRLMKPDSANPYAQAIVYQSGKPFNASKSENSPRGRNYPSALARNYQGLLTKSDPRQGRHKHLFYCFCRAPNPPWRFHPSGPANHLLGMRGLHAFGVDDNAAHTLALRQILFFVWVSFAEQKWVILGERRRLPRGAVLPLTVIKEDDMSQTQFGGASAPMSIDQLQNVAMNIVENFCSIVSMPVEVIIRPRYGTRYFPVPVVFFSALMMILLPIFSALATSVTQMIPFVRVRPPIGLFSIASLSKLYFLLAFVHGIRLYRRMIDMSREQNSEFEGPPLPFFYLLPGSGSFWFTRIVLEPAVVFVAATLLEGIFIFQSGLATFLHFAALALAMKNFIGWYKAWEYLRQLMDMRFAAPIIAKLVGNQATEDDLAPIHLASFPKNLSPDIRQAAVSHIARVFSPGAEIPEVTMPDPSSGTNSTNGENHDYNA